MKKLSIILFAILGLALNVNAQGPSEDSKEEYRYWSFLLGINHSFGGGNSGDNNDVMLHTDRGDMYRTKGSGFNYVPGFQVGMLYNIDLKNNKTGILTGLEVTAYGCKHSFEDRKTGNYTLKETYRAMSVAIPVLFKFGTQDIYREMQYFNLGVRAHYNIMAQRGQKASWTSQKYGEKLEADAKNNLSVSAVLGVNYKMLSLDIDYMFMNFINSDYTVGEYKPFNHVKGNIYIFTSIKVPLTRWLSVHNWQAEKFRRKLHGTESSY